MSSPWDILERYGNLQIEHPAADRVTNLNIRSKAERRMPATMALNEHSQIQDTNSPYAYVHQHHQLKSQVQEQESKSRKLNEVYGYKNSNSFHQLLVLDHMR